MPCDQCMRVRRAGSNWVAAAKTESSSPARFLRGRCEWSRGGDLRPTPLPRVFMASLMPSVKAMNKSPGAMVSASCR